MTNTGVALIWSKGGYVAGSGIGYALIVAGKDYEELKPVTFMREYNGRHARFRIGPGMHLVECKAVAGEYPVLIMYEVIEIMAEKSKIRTKQIYCDGEVREDYPAEAWNAAQAAYFTAGQRNCRKCHHMKEVGDNYGC